MKNSIKALLIAIAALAAPLVAAYGYSGGYGGYRAEPAETAIVIAVVPQVQEEARGWGQRHGPTALGAGIGAAAARNESREVQVLAVLVGGYVGNRVGDRPRRVRGYDTVLEFEDGRRVAIFTREDPGVFAGDEVFLVGRNRIVRAR